VTVTVSNSVYGASSVTTWDAGGYSLHVYPGTYTVTVSGGNLLAEFGESLA
jgi:hypothetical protein